VQCTRFDQYRTPVLYRLPRVQRARDWRARL